MFFRAVPVPDELLNTLELVHGIRKTKKLDTKLWNCSHATAWRKVKFVMQDADITSGPKASPKGLRHGYGIHAISSGVPLNMLSKWMGHSSMETTSIYATAVGAEQKKIAELMWTP